MKTMSLILNIFGIIENHGQTTQYHLCKNSLDQSIKEKIVANAQVKYADEMIEHYINAYKKEHFIYESDHNDVGNADNSKDATAVVILPGTLDNPFTMQLFKRQIIEALNNQAAGQKYSVLY